MSTRSGAELFHQSAEEAYESALHNVLSREGHKDIWREYIYYVRSKSVETAQGWRLLLNCVQRCVLDVEWSHTMPRLHVATDTHDGDTNHTPDPTTGSLDKGDTYKDYTFHNEVSQLSRISETLLVLWLYIQPTFSLTSLFLAQMISVVTDCLSPSSPYTLDLLRKFARLLPNNTILLSR